MQLSKRIDAFHQLGLFFNDFLQGNATNHENQNSSVFFEKLETAINASQIHNSWFTLPNITTSLNGWRNLLTKENLERWMAPYNLPKSNNNPKNIGVIMAGNIPLVGLHDFLSVIITGNILQAKLSSKDIFLYRFIKEFLVSYDNEFNELINFTEDRLTKYDAIIATGSNNTGRYFEYYFGKHPNIIRKNRSSIAILSGNETTQEYDLLIDDVLIYFGLGCRNISKLYVPKDFDPDLFFTSSLKYADIANHNKYANNYDYNRAVYLMNLIPFLENNVVILKEDSGLSSPIGVVFYERYNTIDDVTQTIAQHKDEIQCVSSNMSNIANAIPFGVAQQPQLTDYADNIDTIKFLIELP